MAFVLATKVGTAYHYAKITEIARAVKNVTMVAAGYNAHREINVLKGNYVPEVPVYQAVTVTEIVERI
jgi:hypothetical protein